MKYLISGVTVFVLLLSVSSLYADFSVHPPPEPYNEGFSLPFITPGSDSLTIDSTVISEVVPTVSGNNGIPYGVVSSATDKYYAPPYPETCPRVSPLSRFPLFRFFFFLFYPRF